MPYDLLIRHAQLHRREGLVDLAIEAGRFAKIAPNLSHASAARELDAGGCLLSPPFIDSHVHLDAVLTVRNPRYNNSGTLLEGIQNWSERKPDLSIEDVKERARKAIEWEVPQATRGARSGAGSPA